MSIATATITAGLVGAVGGPLGVSFVTFLYSLVRAPFRLLHEQDEDHRSQISALEEKHDDEVQLLRQSHGREMNQLRTQLEAFKAAERRGQSLGQDANDLLLAAAARREDIWVTDLHVGTTSKCFATVANRPEHARWKAAVDQLHATGLIEQLGDQGCFSVTHSGYQKADLLKPP